MKRWDITPIDLTDLIIERKLTLYDPFYETPRDPKSIQDWISYLNKHEVDLGLKLPLADQRNKYIFKVEDIISLETEHNYNPEAPDIKEKNLRQYQIH